MEFSDYAYKDLYAYLMLQNATLFRITMERQFAEPKDDKIMIVTEYYDALYFGEKLSELTNDFSYTCHLNSVNLHLLMNSTQQTWKN